MINSQIFEKSSLPNYWNIALYMLFLAPITISISGSDGLSANYLFVLLLLKRKSILRNNVAASYIVFMTISFLMGVLIYSGLESSFMSRQITSYIVALIGVSLLFVNLKGSFNDILLAIVFSAVAYSLFAIYMIVSEGFLSTDIYFIKGGLREYVPDWPQRYVIVLLLAFFITIGRWSTSVLWQFATVIIFSCIFFTFTRAAWISVVIGLFFYFLLRTKQKKTKISNKQRLNLFIAFCLLLLLFDVGSDIEIIRIGFQTLYKNIELISNFNTSDFSSNSSEGQRFLLWKIVLDVISVNPFTGTGFAGIYLFTSENGSTHNQYIDILLRTGIIGLAFYLWFWNKLIRFYSKFDISIASGLISLIIMGLFHETNKLSYGAFIFFILLNKSFERQK